MELCIHQMPVSFNEYEHTQANASSCTLWRSFPSSWLRRLVDFYNLSQSCFFWVCSNWCILSCFVSGLESFPPHGKETRLPSSQGLSHQLWMRNVLETVLITISFAKSFLLTATRVIDLSLKFAGGRLFRSLVIICHIMPFLLLQCRWKWGILVGVRGINVGTGIPVPRMQFCIHQLRSSFDDNARPDVVVHWLRFHGLDCGG